ncbi:hypothetical protein XH97_00155 [Bradyrhizobium sp. CCBAU 53380]|nr:hypothetical protein [Bradyrhizobium sp. CCBAU 53380]
MKPRKGFAKDYFKIENELQLMTQRPGRAMDNFFATFGATEFIVRQSIVPIVAWIDGDEEIRCIGTGFFISASGILLTAAHVLRDPVDENYSNFIQVGERTQQFSDDLHFGVLLPTNPAMKNAPFPMHPVMREANWFMCPFEWAYHWGSDVVSPLLHQKPEFRSLLDIAVCKVQEHALIGAYQPLNIGLYNLKLGDRAVAIGYPEMRNIRLKDDDYQPELVVSVGSVTSIYPDNITERHNSTPGPNFEFDAKIPGKMSGSPILVGEGILTKGVVSRSLGSKDNHASGCLIVPVMGLPTINNMSLLDLIRTGNEGIANIQGAGL